MYIIIIMFSVDVKHHVYLVLLDGFMLMNKIPTVIYLAIYFILN